MCTLCERRSPSLNEAFKAGLAVMGNCYASVAGTALVQLKDAPAGTAHYDREGGRPYSGWCTFEQAVRWTNGRVVFAHNLPVEGHPWDMRVTSDTTIDRIDFLVEAVLREVGIVHRVEECEIEGAPELHAVE